METALIINEIEESNECIICLEQCDKISETFLEKTCKCKYYLHQKCLINWINVNKENSCLICKEKVILKELRRSKSGIFTEDMCISMNQLSDALWKFKELGDESAMLKILHPIEELVKKYPRIIVKPSAHESLGNGATLMYPAVSHISTKFKKGDDVVIQSNEGILLAIADAKLDAAIIAAKEKGAIAQPKHVFL